MKARWQKLTAFAMALGVIGYGIHESPASASAMIIGGLFPIFGAFVAGNVASKKAEAKAP